MSFELIKIVVCLECTVCAVGVCTSFSGSLVFLVLAAMAASRSVTGIAGGAAGGAVAGGTAGGAVRRWKEAEDGMNDEHCISVSL